jgi:hypothetical protein
MICFFCKMEIDSDHGCQEVAEFMDGPTTPEAVQEVGARMRQLDKQRERRQGGTLRKHSKEKVK